MDQDNNLTIAEAAKRIGVSPSAVTQMIHKELIPSEKIGKKRYIAENIVVGVIELKKEHGRRWAQHAPWNNGTFESQSDAGEEIPAGLNAKLLTLSKEYRAAGHPDIACRIHDILFDQYDFTGGQ